MTLSSLTYASGWTPLFSVEKFQVITYAGDQNLILLEIEADKIINNCTQDKVAIVSTQYLGLDQFKITDSAYP